MRCNRSLEYHRAKAFGGVGTWASHARTIHGFKYLNARGPRVPEKSRTMANDITTLGCSRANYICQAAGRADGQPALPG